MVEFKHLNDTKYPHFNNVDVYKYRNNFNYYRWWDVDTTIRLVNVRFDSTYANVVKYSSVEKRDEAFDKLTGHKEVLTSDFRIAPNDTIKLPLPFDVALSYNYIYIELPIATSPTQPIAYEGAPRINRFYFFINDVESKAPNTTELKLTLDVWTTYHPYVTFTGGMLKRGHFPVRRSATPERFLQNPISNTQYLTCTDYFIENGKKVIHKDFLHNGSSKMVCFTLPYDYAQLRLTLQSEAIVDDDTGPYHGATPPSYQTITKDKHGKDIWWGKDFQVNDYLWGWGDNYATMGSVIHPDAIARGSARQPIQYVYCVDSNRAGVLFGYLKQYNPNIFRDIKACFVVEKERLNINNTTAIEYHMVTFYRCDAKPVYSNVNLTVSDFDIPEKYKKLTKLYTSPYSKIVITDMEKTVHEIKVQDCSNTTAVAVYTSLNMFKYVAYVEGVGSKGRVNYDVKQFDGSDATQSYLGGDFEKLVFENDIPTYIITISARENFDLDEYYHTDGMRNNAIAAYENATRNANNTEYVELQNNQVAYNNATISALVEKQNDTANAELEKTLATRNYSTNYYNTEQDLAKEQTNAKRIAGANQQTSINSANTQYSITEAAASTNKNITNRELQALGAGGSQHTNRWMASSTSSIVAWNDNVTGGKQGLINDFTCYQVYMQNVMSQMTYDAGYDTKSVVPYNTMIGTAIGGAISGGVAGAASGTVGGPWGAVAGAAVGVIGGIAAGVNNAALLGVEASVIDVQRNVSGIQAFSAGQYADAMLAIERDVTAYKRDITYDVTESNGDTARDNDVNNAGIIYGARVSNADDARAAGDRINTATRDAKQQNTEDVYNTRIANINRTYDKTVEIAEDIFVKANDNTVKTRGVRVLAAQRQLDAAQDTRAYDYFTQNFRQPISITKESGDTFKIDNNRAGYEVKVVTPNDNDVTQMGDYFTRFGYAMNAYTDELSSLQIMRHFTYWEFGDLFAYCDLAPNTAVTKICDIMKQGVTVWSDMAKINAVNIYENL